MNDLNKRDAISYILGDQFLTQLSGDIRDVVIHSDISASDKKLLKKAAKIIDDYADDLHGH